MQRLKRQNTRSSLSIGKAFSGWSNSNGSAQISESMTSSTEPSEIIINHPMTSFLIEEKKLLKYVQHNKLILLLPPIDIINDIPMSVSFVETHLIHLSAKTMMFITLNGLCGKFDEQTLTILNGTKTTNHRPEVLSDILEKATLDEPVFTTRVCGIDEVKYRGNNIITLSIKFPICNLTLPWSWKLKPTQFSSPPPYSSYKLLMELQTSFDEIRKQIPGLEEEEKNDIQIAKGIFPKYFHIDCSESRINALRENEIEIAKFHSQLSFGVNSELEKRIMSFLIEFPSICKGKFLMERKKLIYSFVNEMTEKVRNDIVWHEENGFNSVAFSSNLTMFLLDKLYKCVWPPSIAQIEHLDHTDSIILDSMSHSNSTNHIYLKPKHFGYDGPTDQLDLILSVAVKFFRRIDAVRCPSDKLMCIYCALKAIEQTCYYIGSKCKSSDPFSALTIYSLIQADLTQATSTITYIKEMHETTDSLLLHYFEIFENSFNEIKKLHNRFSKEEKQEYKVLINLRVDEVNWSIFSTQLPNLFLPVLTLDDLRKYFGVFTSPSDRMHQLIFSNPSKLQRDDYADLISFFKTLQTE